jgi:MFS family permease
MIPAFFNNFVSALGLAAITEMAPNQVRARVTAIYVVGTGLLSATLGPLLVGIISDALRPDPAGIAHGLALTSGLIGVPGALLVAWGWKPYRDTLARVG